MNIPAISSFWGSRKFPLNQNFIIPDTTLFAEFLNLQWNSTKNWILQNGHRFRWCFVFDRFSSKVTEICRNYDKNHWVGTFARTNYQLCQKFVIWIIQNLSIFQDGFDFIADQRKMTQFTCKCLRGFAPQTGTCTLFQFSSCQQQNQFSFEIIWQFVNYWNHNFWHNW